MWGEDNDRGSRQGDERKGHSVSWDLDEYLDPFPWGSALCLLLFATFVLVLAVKGRKP